LIVLTIIVALIAVTNALQVRITLNVFTGGEDPSWILTDGAAVELLSQMPSDVTNDVRRPIPWYRMGYRGFEVEVLEVESNGSNGIVKRSFAIYNSFAAELTLLRSANHSLLSSNIVNHVRDESIRLSHLMESNNGVIPDDDVPKPLGRAIDSNENCTLPVRGPDNGTTYAPNSENCGYFVKYQTQNNCYNYGNDVVTNTFAQPGRGTGQKWSDNTCENMKAAAIRDGLTWAGTELPSGNPDVGHYIALLIWPQTNFHWVRLDSVPGGGYWSHKAGQTPVKNVDGRGKRITDPSKQDFSPWTQFCGYMIGVPSKVTIN
jgi:hypothetical protein